jgi:PKD repeat protein
MRVQPARSAHRLTTLLLVAAVVAAVVLGVPRLDAQGSGWKVVAWNNLGMHCMDADFSVFAILPPYNTIQAQVIDPTGQLVTGPTGITLTYQGVADPTGSINTTSVGKTNFWTFIAPLFGVTLPPDVGLLNHNMPGAANTAQPMVFDAALDWFIAEGIPITPYDDRRAKNFYPMMKVSATDSSGALLASTNIVLPVSDEMDCRSCHASGSSDAARPAAGWVFDADLQRDFRFNILRLHDDRQAGNPTYAAALQARGYRATGLYATAAAGQSILCAACHKSEALTGSGFTGIPPLTASIHTQHATVIDPTNGLTLESSTNRSACYRCHPGSETRCLRGTMGNAVAADGSMAIQCQNCHGPMSAVGSSSRTGWLNEPTCQNCHTGTATANSGAIRFTSVFDSTGQPRVAANATFATTNNSPAAGLNLYRFSAGHGGMQCSACHGSTHAEYPSSHPNDNIQSVALQGHAGTIGECTACHSSSPSTTTGGPHGMHPVGAAWVEAHHEDTFTSSSKLAACQACHGTDYRGTVLSRAFSARTLTTEFGTRTLFRGAQVGCYMCHNGPSSESRNANRPAVANDLSSSTSSGRSVDIGLSASDPDGNPLTLRIVSQPVGGTVGLSGTTATYFPYVGFSGTDTFTYAAWDNSIDSNLATVTVTVGNTASCSVTATASAPASAPAGAPVTFTGSAAATNCADAVTYDWNFGDGSPHGTAQSPSHAYASGGTYQWSLTAAAGATTTVRTGTITITPGAPQCAVTVTASVPAAATVGVPVSFSAAATATNCSGSVAYSWTFGDGTAAVAGQNANHTYATAATFQWQVSATASGVTATRNGSIVVSTGTTSTLSITRVTSLSDPFRIRIEGTGFQQGVKVYIGSRTTPWASTRFNSSTRLTLSGEGLSRLFPRGQPVTIRVVNPDGNSVSTTFTRR